jgi:asparagine synthase (glutamine-hydrolysing)
LRHEAWVKDSPADSIERTEELFRQAVSAEYDKDRECGYRHLAHLSGGLDSRMNVFVARELGYDGILNMTFSQCDYLDEKVAKRIAADLGNEFLFYALDNGNFLRHTLSDAVMANGGLVLYSGAAHELTMYRSINWEPFGVVHSGQIGDAVLGSFLRTGGPATLSVDCAIDARLLLDRIAPTIKRIQAHYESVEAFKIMSRALNGAPNGNWMGNQYSEVLSPFLHLEFLEYCWGLPRDRLVHEKHYLAWIEAKHPRAGRYARTPSGLRPGANRFLLFLLWFIDGSRRRLWGAQSKWSMHPFDYWYRTNPALRDYVAGYCGSHLSMLAGHPQLHADCGRLFQEGNLIEKTQVMTLLEAMKLFFPQSS